MDYPLNLSQAADLLAELTSNPRIKDDIVRIIMLGAEGRIPVYWRNSLGRLTTISACMDLLSDEQKGPLPHMNLLSDWLQLDAAFLFHLEVEQQIQCWTFEITEEDCSMLPRIGKSVFDEEGSSNWFRHTLDYENVTVSRNQLYIDEHHLRKYAAMLASAAKPIVPSAPKEAGVDQPQKAIPRSKVQDDAIIAELKNQGYDPLALPKHSSGKPGVPAQLKSALLGISPFQTINIFDHAWERLTKNKDIQYKK